MAKGWTVVRMIMILNVDVTAEGGIIKLIAPSRGNERYEGKNSESYTSRTISAFSLFGGCRHHLALWEACHMIQKSKSRNADFILIAREGDTTTLGAKGPVKLKNPWAEGPSILRTFPFITLLHNPPPKGGHNPRAGGPSTLTPAGRVQRRVQSFLCPT